MPYPLLIDITVSVEDKLRFIIKFANDQSLSRDIRLQPIWILWRLWKARNELLYAQSALTESVLLQRVYNDVKEWIQITEHEFQAQQTTGSSNISSKWQKPPLGWVKCNFDVAHREGNNPSGLGWIVRNHAGTFLNSGNGVFEGRTTVQEAECSSLLWAIQCCWGLGYQRVIFEGNNLGVMQLLASENINLKLQSIIYTIKAWKNCFAGIQFSHKKRDGNRCADMLAKKALLSSEPFNIYHSCPSYLKLIVITDAT